MASYFPAYVNLLKTAIGSGILAYPFLFMTYGVFPTLLISMIAAFFSFIGLVLYIESTVYVSNNKDNVSLSSLAKLCYPRSRAVADLAICFKCFGVSISYLIIVRQLFPIILIYIFGNKFFANPTVSLFIFLIVTCPLSYFKKIDKLKYTSFCGILCIIIMIFSTIYRAYETKEFKTKDIRLSTPLSLLWITGIGKFIFSFTCHQNIFSVQNEIISGGDKNSKNMIRLSAAVIITAFFAYILFGFLNYLIYGNLIFDNILESFPNDGLALIVQGLYVVVMGFSYPLQINPCRLHFIELFGMNGNSSSSNIENDNKNLIRQDLEDGNIIRIIITTLMLISSYLIAVSGIELGSVYSIIGATAGSLMCYIFPGIFYLKLNMPMKKKKMVIVSIISIIFGIAISTSAFVVFISKIIKATKKQI